MDTVLTNIRICAYVEMMRLLVDWSHHDFSVHILFGFPFCYSLRHPMHLICR